VTQQQPGQIPVPPHPEPLDPPADPNGPSFPTPKEDPPTPHPHSPPPTTPEPSDPQKAPVITPAGDPEILISEPPVPGRTVDATS
jgi:hypothetical protein